MKKLILLILFVALTCSAQVGLRSPAFVANLHRLYQPDIAWWKCNENTGTNVADSSTRGTNNLTLFSASMWTTGHAEGGLAGNGSSYYAATSNLLNFVTNITTVCFWIKDASYTPLEIQLELSVSAGTVSNTFVAYTATSLFSLYDGGALGLARQETVATPSTGAWHHIACVIDAVANSGNGELRIWYDGVEQSTALDIDNKAGSDNFANVRLYLLARGGASSFSAAIMDDIRIYSGNRAADIPGIYTDTE